MHRSGVLSTDVPFVAFGVDEGGTSVCTRKKLTQ